jgi:hypothetical protein
MTGPVTILMLAWAGSAPAQSLCGALERDFGGPLYNCRLQEYERDRAQARRDEEYRRADAAREARERERASAAELADTLRILDGRAEAQRQVIELRRQIINGLR